MSSAQPSTPTQPLRPRLPRRPLHGVLLLDKPLGWTSNDALQKVKNLLRAEKAGHTGTLDPLATGLLPLCFGAATKFSQASLDADKCYRATLALGATTRGGDREGEVLLERPPVTDRAAIAQALAAHRGRLSQVPPMQSALKHQGKALYEYARQGVEIEREAREVQIHRLDVVCWPDEALTADAAAGEPGAAPGPWPELVIDVVCSKGTYVRTLAETIGEMLGCGAHLRALRRTGSGPLDLARAVSLADLEAADDATRLAHLLPPDVLLADCPAVHLPEAEAGRFLSGLRRPLDQPDQARVRVYGPGLDGAAPVLLGSARLSAGELIAERLLSPPEVAALMQPAALSPPLSHPPIPSGLAAPALA